MGSTGVTQLKPSLRKVSFDKQFQKPALKKKLTSPTAISLLGSYREASHEIVEAPKPDMAASFLQFCAMCEKQIMTPCNSILYCSEACRRKDGCKPLSAATLVEMTPPSSAPSSPSKPILMARVPTGSYQDLPSSARIPPELHDHRPDLDPTEWKPKLRRQHGQQSEAFRYLSRFHQSTTSMGDINASDQSDVNIACATASMPVSVPSLTTSLSGTPTTTVSTNSSSSFSANVGVVGHEYGHTYAGAYDFNTRPLPSRHNRWFSVSGATPKGTDLVTPHVAPPVISVSLENTETGEDLWGKKVIVQSRKAQGGMGALFGRE